MEPRGETGSRNPLPERERLRALDVLRGVALLGILIVNAAYFAMPVMTIREPSVAFSAEPGEWIAWGVVKAFFELRFVTLFSLLFGMGFALQSRRVGEQHGGFARVYLRRLGWLAVLGLAHGVLLFDGDILFVYALCGAALLLLRGMPPLPSLLVGASLLVTLSCWYGLLAWVEADGQPPLHLSVDLAALEREVELGGELHATPPSLEVAVWSLVDVTQESDHARIELVAYRHGPLWLTVLARTSVYALFLLESAFYFGWRCLAMFLVGFGAMRMGLFDVGRRRLWAGLAVGGLGIGLPLGAAGTILVGIQSAEPGSLWALGQWLHEAAALPTVAGLIGAVALWTASDRPGALQRGVAATGRMALTVYISQSVVMSAVTCWYGLGLYGELSRPALLGLALGVYAVQVAACALWLRFFVMGPLEWVWRRLTYGGPLALRR